MNKHQPKISDGDKKADLYISLFQTYYSKLYDFCSKHLRSETDIEDVVQESFKALWEMWDSVDGSKNIVGLLFTITNNKIYDILRKKYTYTKHSDGIEDAMAENWSEGDMELWDELIHLMFSTVDKLPERQREIILLRGQGLTNPQIAHRLEISEGTVKNQYSRAMSTLRDILGPDKISIIVLLFPFI